MSNIRTIRDLPSNSRPVYVPLDVSATRNNSGSPTRNNSGSPSTSANDSPGVNTLRTTPSAWENIKDYLYSIFLSGFKVMSFTFICTMIQLAVFIISQIITLSQEGEYLHNYSCVLYKLGAAHSPSLVTYYQLYRLVAPMFLHGDVGHIFVNLTSQWSLGFKLEAAYGTKKMAFMWFLTGISGSLLSGVAHQWDLCVGASTAGFGLSAWWLAHLIDNYQDLGPQRRRYISWFVMMLLWNVSYGLNSDNIDNSGHAGGFIGGILLVTQLMRWTDDEKWRKTQKIALGLWILYVVGICIYFISIRSTLERRADRFYKLCDIPMN